MEIKKDASRAEFQILDILWQKGQANVREVQTAICETRPVAYTTVATLLTRLREKGYVKAKEKNFSYIYTPTVQRDQVVRRKLTDLINLVFDGSVASLAAYLAENKDLPQKQIKALEEVIKAEKRK